jgi:DNA-directed RNA polymerase subunit RPC12/RpoP
MRIIYLLTLNCDCYFWRMNPKNIQIILGTATEYEGRTYHKYTGYGCAHCDNELRIEYNPPFYTKIMETDELLCPNCASNLEK